MIASAPYQFSENARTCRIFARDQASEKKHPCIGSQHWLLGMFQHKDDLATRVLLNNGITLEAVQKEFPKFVEACGHSTPAFSIKQSPRLERIIDKAARDAADARSEQLELFHFALAMFDVPDCAAVRIITALGIDTGTLQHELRQAFITGQIIPKIPSPEQYVDLKRALGNLAMTDAEAVRKATAFIKERKVN